MGGKKKAPDPKPYIEPTPNKKVGLQDPYESTFRLDTQKRLAGYDNDFNDMASMNQQAFQDNLEQQMRPLRLNTINDIQRRMGGLNTSVTTDMMQPYAQAQTQAVNNYVMNQPERYLNIQNALLNQLQGLADREAQAEMLGLQRANPQNQYNLGLYGQQLGYMQGMDANRKALYGSLAQGLGSALGGGG